MGTVDSPLGLIEVGATAMAVVSCLFVEQLRRDVVSNPVVELAIRQLGQYLAGDRREFDLPILLQGTGFQKRVWQQLLAIPFGQTSSYLDIAIAIGNPKAVRAVGAANGQNPISIIVPCHRVVGSDGSLVGYGGGLWRKEWLLRHEGSLLL
ncbi:MAG: methylated-DNA--[protein]-cysteine S-methyltransferase [Anaerolineae bacterium]|nr:methylated-DNA--[protein]-cysteine S-methyltransferase [Anaerolineae bacterium]